MRKLKFLWAKSFALALHKPRLSAVFAGLVASASIPPLSFWWLFFLGFAALIGLLSHASSPFRRAQLMGWFTFGWTVFSLHWIANSMFVDFARHWPLIVPTLMGLPFAHAIVFGFVAWLAFKLVEKLKPQIKLRSQNNSGDIMVCAALLPSIWSVAETARLFIFSGFTWNATSIIWADMPIMMQAVRYIGSQGLSAATLIAAASLGLIWAQSVRIRIIGVTLLAIIGIGFTGYGAWSLTFAPPILPTKRIEHGNWAHIIQTQTPEIQSAPQSSAITDTDQGIRVRIIQTATPQHLKWRQELSGKFYEQLLALTRIPHLRAIDGQATVQPTYDQENQHQPNGGAPNKSALNKQPENAIDVIVWPEVSFTGLLESDFRARQTIARAANGAHVLVGGVKKISLDDSEQSIQVHRDRYYNSVFAIDPKGRIIGRYDKARLVPFGEYIPVGPFEHLIIPLAEAIAGMSGTFLAGGTPAPVFENTPFAVLPMICYESAFPIDVNTGDALWLANLSNSAWFGDWIGPSQHERNSRMRALETGRPLVQSTNMGESTVTDPWGRVIASAKLGEIAVIDLTLPLPLATAFNIGGTALSLWIVFLCSVMSAIVLFAQARLYNAKT